MLIVGLTGSIGSGKSLAAKSFRALDVPVHDSDIEVHKLLAEHQELIGKIQNRWPTAVEEGVIIRRKLGEIVFADRVELKVLEGMIFPYLRQVHRQFLAEQAKLGSPLVVIDMPLLFETGMDELMDVTVCVIAEDHLRLERVLRRENMTEEKFHQRDRFQMPQDEKRERADYIIQSGDFEKEVVHRQVEDIIHKLAGQNGQAWEKHWQGKEAL